MNEYVYCANNPITFIDPDGDIPIVLVAMVAWNMYNIYSTAKDAKSFAKKPTLGGGIMVVAGVTPVGKVKTAAGVAKFWSKGRFGDSATNLTYHFKKHSKELGVRTKVEYTKSALKTVKKATEKYVYKNGIKIAYKQGKKITVLAKKKIVTHFIMKKNYWSKNVKLR